MAGRIGWNGGYGYYFGLKIMNSAIKMMNFASKMIYDRTVRGGLGCRKVDQGARRRSVWIWRRIATSKSVSGLRR